MRKSQECVVKRDAADALLTLANDDECVPQEIGIYNLLP